MRGGAYKYREGPAKKFEMKDKEETQRNNRPVQAQVPPFVWPYSQTGVMSNALPQLNSWAEAAQFRNMLQREMFHPVIQQALHARQEQIERQGIQDERQHELAGAAKRPLYSQVALGNNAVGNADQAAPVYKPIASQREENKNENTDGAISVGCRVSVYWDGEKRWFNGTVKACSRENGFLGIALECAVRTCSTC